MNIDGNALALNIHLALSRVRASMSRSPVLGIVLVGDDAPSLAYVKRKILRAKELEIEVRLTHITGIDTASVVAAVQAFAADDSVDAVMVQLPLPEGVDRDAVLRAVPMGKDVDVLSPDARGLFAQELFPILPPMVGAVQYLFEHHSISVSGREALVVGHGILVGAPIAQFLRHCGARVTVVDRPVRDLAEFSKDAELIVLGTGHPRLLLPSHVREGSIVIDAGMRVVDGKLSGDADKGVAEKCALFTPTPGGLGPLVVAMLMKNILVLAKRRGA